VRRRHLIDVNGVQSIEEGADAGRIFVRVAVAAEATTDTPIATSATPMRSFRNNSTTRRPE
jgi:hypothetical protein